MLLLPKSPAIGQIIRSKLGSGLIRSRSPIILSVSRLSTQRPLLFNSVGNLWNQAQKDPSHKESIGLPPSALKVKAQVKKVSKAPTLSELKILKDLFRYIWPKENNKVRVRVLVALGLLISAKILNVQVPFFFKQTIDSMNIAWDDPTVALPAAIGLTILCYGVARFGSVLFGELRNAVFARVAQNAIRTVSLQTFQHLMKLDLGWHLSRQTGGLTRAMDRGTKGISQVLTAMVFHLSLIHI